MDWGILFFITLLFASLLITGLVHDYQWAKHHGWRPLVDFGKIWSWIKDLFRRTS
jgi:hypothetical protein